MLDHDSNAQKADCSTERAAQFSLMRLMAGVTLVSVVFAFCNWFPNGWIVSICVTSVFICQEFARAASRMSIANEKWIRIVCHIVARLWYAVVGFIDGAVATVFLSILLPFVNNVDLVEVAAVGGAVGGVFGFAFPRIVARFGIPLF
jgi:hypothetical protein